MKKTLTVEQKKALKLDKALIAKNKKALKKQEASPIAEKLKIQLPDALPPVNPLESEDRVVVCIKRDPKCFNDNFFNRALELCLQNDFPDWDKRTDIKVLTDDETVHTACLIQRIQCEMIKHGEAPDANVVICFWDGADHKALPPELVSPNANTVSQWLANYNKAGEQYFTHIKHQYPNIKFRAISLLYKGRNRGLNNIDLKTYVIQNIHKWEDTHQAIEGQLSNVVDSPINQASVREDIIVATTGNSLGREDDPDLSDVTHDQLVSEASEKRHLQTELKQAYWQRLLWSQAMVQYPSFIAR